MLPILAACLSATSALAMGPMTMLPPPPQAPQAVLQADTLERARRNEKIRHQLVTLRDEGLKLREADGGTLTEEHRAYLQGKLDRIRKDSGGQ